MQCLWDCAFSSNDRAACVFPCCNAPSITASLVFDAALGTTNPDTAFAREGADASLMDVVAGFALKVLAA